MTDGRKGLWVTRDRRALSIPLMEDSHIINAVWYCRRHPNFLQKRQAQYHTLMDEVKRRGLNLEGGFEQQDVGFLPVTVEE